MKKYLNLKSIQGGNQKQNGNYEGLESVEAGNEVINLKFTFDVFPNWC